MRIGVKNHIQKTETQCYMSCITSCFESAADVDLLRFCHRRLEQNNETNSNSYK
jgi:hypothetical protein